MDARSGELVLKDECFAVECNAMCFRWKRCYLKRRNIQLWSFLKVALEVSKGIQKPCFNRFLTPHCSPHPKGVVGLGYGLNQQHIYV